MPLKCLTQKASLFGQTLTNRSLVGVFRVLNLLDVFTVAQ
jgi:hypothetical protein